MQALQHKTEREPEKLPAWTEKVYSLQKIWGKSKEHQLVPAMGWIFDN